MNAPWPFRTMTAAVASIPTLPTTSQTGIRWMYAILHLLPGWYASVQFNTSLQQEGATGNYYYLDNGLLASGENFPIQLPDRVSIQGTSVLNTVIQLAEENNNSEPEAAFQFGMAPGNTGVGNFVSHVSIFGHYHEVLAGQSQLTAAAVYCGRVVPSTPTFTNCWFFGNECAFCLDAPTQVPDQNGMLDTWHEATITNCTFAWNKCGIWNGMQNAPNEVPPRPSFGRSRTILINNIFDSTPTQGPAMIRSRWQRTFPPFPTVGKTNFEGISQADMQMSAPSFRNWNAFERRDNDSNPTTGYNRNIQIGILPPTSVMPAGGKWASPFAPGTATWGINLSDYTGNTSTTNQRGIIFIRDLMENGRAAGVAFRPNSNDVDFDACPGDFRLSPAVAVARPSATPPGDTTYGGLSPVVDSGWNPTSSTNFPVTMWNGLTLTDYPGTLPMTTPIVPFDFHNWNWDGEGHGNPRILNHPAYTSAGDDRIDMGGDELGEEIVAGFRFGTTHFARINNLHHPVGRAAPVVNNILPQSNRYLWFLGVAKNHAQPLVDNNRPYFRVIDTVNTRPWVDLWDFAPKASSLYYEPETTDITPHLLPDIHPYWIGVFANKPSNPVWQHCLGAPLYNVTLYLPVDLAIINAPGAYKGFGTDYRWLDGTGTSPVFTQFAALGGPAAIDYFDDWCRARENNQPSRLYDTFPDYVTAAPPTLIISRRYSLEHKQKTPWRNSLDGSNLQSFNVMTKTFQ